MKSRKINHQKSKNQKIAFFDSGLGGLTVLAKAVKQLPTENFLYFADNSHVPYGGRSKQEVESFVQTAVKKIFQYQVKALVIACNTATSTAITTLRRQYDIPIIGMEPAVKPALELNGKSDKRVLVIATELTLAQIKYSQLISRLDENHLVDALALPKLVELSEQLVFDRAVVKDYFCDKLRQFNLNNYSTVVLGCTHFLYFKKILKNFLPAHVSLVDGAAGTVNRLKQVLSDQASANFNGQGSVVLLCSDNSQLYLNNMKQAFEILS